MMSPEFSKQDWVSESELRQAGLPWPLALLPSALLQRNSIGQVCLTSSIAALEMGLGHDPKCIPEVHRLRGRLQLQETAAKAPPTEPKDAGGPRQASLDLNSETIADRRHALRLLRFLAHAVDSRRQRQLRQTLAERPSSTVETAHCLPGLRGAIRFLEFDGARSLLAHAADDDFIARWDLAHRQISGFPWCDPNLYAYGRADEEVALRFVFRGSDANWTMGFASPNRPEHIEFVPSDEHGPALGFRDSAGEASGSHHSVSSSADGQWLASLCRDLRETSQDTTQDPGLETNIAGDAPTDAPEATGTTPERSNNKVIHLFTSGVARGRVKKTSRVRLFHRAPEDARYEPLLDLKFRDDIEHARLDPTGRQLLIVGHREIALWDLVDLHSAFDRIEPGSVPADDSRAANQAHGARFDAHRALDSLEIEARAGWIEAELDVLVPRAPRWRQRLSGDRQVSAVAFSDDGRSIVIGHADGDCAWLRASQGTTITTLPRPRSTHQRATPCTQLSFMPNTGFAVAGFASGELALLELASGTTKQSWRLGDQPVTCFAWSENLSHLAIGHADGDIWVQASPTIDLA